MKSLFTILACFLILSACTPSTATRGNYLYAEDIQSIQPMISTEFDVLNILGTPTAKAVFDENTWYYVGLKTEQESFFDEKVTERRIYQVTFDESKFVKSISEVSNDPIDVPIASRVTPTSGNEVTALQQILGNIGKFNPPSQ
jgi:outer membrane protein assembly factor BamE (lipoprotein component of BamABCDE complex)